jgi:ParB-like chromosome segregation protein Spo0J
MRGEGPVKEQRKPWASRIVGHGDVPPESLTANPRNWRKHPDAQRKALAGALSEVGWVAQVIVNKRTGHVVDGHARVELAVERKEAMVPVVYVDLTPDEEAVVLACLDSLSAMATTDTEKLDSSSTA